MSQFQAISGKKLRVFPEACYLKHLYIFLKLTTAFERSFINIILFISWEIIQIIFFYILISINYSSYDRISESQKNQPSIKYYSMDLQK
jgi:hypothetical protein